MSNNRTQRLLSHVHHLLEVAILDSAGEVKWKVDFAFHSRMTLLVAELMKHSKLPDDEQLGRQIVKQTLVELKKRHNETPSWNDYEALQAEQTKNYLNKPWLNWGVLCPLHLIGPWIAHKRCLHVLGTRFLRLSWRQLQRKPGWTEFASRSRLPLYRLGDRFTLTSKFTALFGETHARTELEAMNEIERDFQVLLGLLNLSQRFAKWTRQFGIGSKPLAVCLSPPIYGVFRSDGSYEQTYISIYRHEYEKTTKLEQTAGSDFERWLHRLNALSDGIKALVVDLLLKYQRAMETTDWAVAYLTLWQILESASLSTLGNQLRMDEIARRVLTLSGYTPVVDDLVDLLCRWRNELVHLGNYSQTTLHRVNYLKLIAEITIVELIRRARTLRNRQTLQEFYVHARRPEGVLRTRRKVIDHLLRSH